MSEETIIRTAVVTGGSRGIGRAVCIQLAKQGCNVVVNYCHGEAAAAETVALCKAENADAVAVQADVSTAEGCKALFEQAVNAFGRVDILVNNAGITRDNLILRMSEEDFDAVLNANLKGAFLCCKEAARRMVRQRWGRIVNLSSVVALRGNAGQTNYAASKAGLIGLTKSLARELASRNVTVNAVAPGFIETDMTAALPEAVRAEMAKGIPAGRAGKPEDVANAVAFFAAEQSSCCTTCGQYGYSAVPSCPASCGFSGTGFAAGVGAGLGGSGCGTDSNSAGTGAAGCAACAAGSSQGSIPACCTGGSSGSGGSSSVWTGEVCSTDISDGAEGSAFTDFGSAAGCTTGTDRIGGWGVGALAKGCTAVAEANGCGAAG